MLLSDTPSHRPHDNILCACPQCKRYDYADTLELSFYETPTTKLSAPSVSPVLYKREEVEIIHAYDTETGERHDYALVVSSPFPPFSLSSLRNG
jgi:hypothetical protein